MTDECKWKRLDFNLEELLEKSNDKEIAQAWSIREVAPLEVTILAGMPSVEDYIDKEEQ